MTPKQAHYASSQIAPSPNTAANLAEVLDNSLATFEEVSAFHEAENGRRSSFPAPLGTDTSFASEVFVNLLLDPEIRPLFEAGHVTAEAMLKAYTEHTVEMMPRKLIEKALRDFALEQQPGLGGPAH